MKIETMVKMWTMATKGKEDEGEDDKGTEEGSYSESDLEAKVAEVRWP